MDAYLINQIVDLKERKKLLETIESEVGDIEIFTDREINEALELKEHHQLHDELNKVNILLSEDEKQLMHHYK